MTTYKFMMLKKDIGIRQEFYVHVPKLFQKQKELASDIIGYVDAKDKIEALKMAKRQLKRRYGVKRFNKIKLEKWDLNGQ